MYTQCPECLTIYEIDEDAVQASLGIVHCGHCAQRFDALRTLSDTLPAEPNVPLAEQDPAELVPTLTMAVPLPAFELAARKQHLRGNLVPAQESGLTDFHPEAVAGESQPPEAGQPLPAASSEDWFADLETKLTSSLIADVTSAPSDEASGNNTWQVSDVPDQSSFSDADIPIIFEESGTVRTGKLETHGRIEGESAMRPDSEPSDAATSVTTEATDVSSIAQTKTAFDAIDRSAREEFGQLRSGEPVSPWMDVPDIETPNPDSLTADEATPVSVARNVVLPASIPLPLKVADDGIAVTPGAMAAEPEPARTEVESDTLSSSVPVYVRPRRGRHTGAVWALGCLLLALVLAAQLAWIKRVELFRNPATHAWAASVCQIIACRLPPIKDIAKLELLSRDVRPDPHATGALMVTTTVRNNATFRQPWPVVVVELTGLDNNPVAMRRFRPAEYMPDPARRAAGIAPGATAAIALEVADPGKRAVAFQFSFQ